MRPSLVRAWVERDLHVGDLPLEVFAQKYVGEIQRAILLKADWLNLHKNANFEQRSNNDDGDSPRDLFSDRRSISCG